MFTIYPDALIGPIKLADFGSTKFKANVTSSIQEHTCYLFSFISPGTVVVDDKKYNFFSVNSIIFKPPRFGIEVYQTKHCFLITMLFLL